MHVRAFALALAVAACSRAPDAPPAPVVAVAPAPVAAAPPVDAAAPVDANPNNQITVTIKPRPADRAVAATRCSLDGDPLNGDYMRGSLTIAAVGGALYVADGVDVRRYLRGSTTGCALVLDQAYGAGGVMVPPPIPAKAQLLDHGPVYLSSGTDWRLSPGAGGAVYDADYTRGLYRIDRGKFEPVCPATPGIRTLAVVGGGAYIDRDGGARLALGGACKVTPHVLAEPVREVWAVHGAVYGEADANHVVRLGEDGKVAARFGGDETFKPGGLCAVAGVVPCGDMICMLDTNCRRVAMFAPDGRFVRQLDADDLFAQRVYGISAIAAAPNGLWLAVVHKDGEVSEGAIYWVPLAAIGAGETE